MIHGDDGLTAVGGVPIARFESSARSTGVEVTMCSNESHGLTGGVISSRPKSLCSECCCCSCCSLGDGGGSSGLGWRVSAGSSSLGTGTGDDVGEGPMRDTL